MIRAFAFSFLAVAAFSLNTVADPAPASAPPAKPNPPAPAKPAPWKPTYYRDETVYPPLRVAWKVLADPAQVTSVFPHPTLNQRAVLATRTGVYLTEDAGQIWTALADAGADKIGPVLDVAFDPLSADTFYLGSSTKGVWTSTDKGKTFAQIGGKAQGMAADKVVGVMVYPGDVTHQTLLAAHGDGALGLSRSRDHGKTWDVVNGDYRFTRLLGGEGDSEKLLLFGSAEKEPDVQTLYTCTTLGEPVSEVVRDIVPTDMVLAPNSKRKAPIVWLSTSDGGLKRVEESGEFGTVSNDSPDALKDVSNVAGVGATWGASADLVNLYLYDPAKLGLVVSTDNFATFRAESNGLPVSSLVKEGAVLRPNANGTAFYAIANGTLAVGRVPDEVPVVTVTPASVEVDAHEEKAWRNLAAGFDEFAKSTDSTADAANALLKAMPDLLGLHHQHDFAVTARVPVKPAAPASVTLDLSRFEGSPQTPLYDDGQHGDGAAGDGLYGVTFAFLPGRHPPAYGSTDWRNTWPGRVPLGVSVAYADGRHEGAVGVVAVYTKTSDHNVWDPQWEGGLGAKMLAVDGSATAEPFDIPSPTQAKHRYPNAITVTTKSGAWSVHIKLPSNHDDLGGYEAIALWMKMGDGEVPKELYAQLRDAPEFSLPTLTDRIPALNGTVLTGDYQRVVIPISALIGPAAQFQSDHVGELILSGESAAPMTLLIEGLQLLARTDSTAPDPATQ